MAGDNVNLYYLNGGAEATNINEFIDLLRVLSSACRHPKIFN